MPHDKKPRYAVKGTTTPHKSELVNADTGEVVPAPYIAIDRPMMESAAWHALPSKEHEIYPALKAKWGSESNGGTLADTWIPFGVADCTKYGIKIEWQRLQEAMLRFEQYGFIEFRRTGLASGTKNGFRLTDEWRKWKPDTKEIAQKPNNGDIGKTTYLRDMGKTLYPRYGENPISAPCKRACEGGDCKSNRKIGGETEYLRRFRPDRAADFLAEAKTVTNPERIADIAAKLYNGSCRDVFVEHLKESSELKTATDEIAGILSLPDFRSPAFAPQVNRNHLKLKRAQKMLPSSVTSNRNPRDIPGASKVADILPVIIAEGLGGRDDVSER